MSLEKQRIRSKASQILKEIITRKLKNNISESVNFHVESLKNAGLNKDAHALAFDAIKKNSSLSKEDVADIAVAYRGGGSRPKTVSEAHALIEKRFLEIRRDHNQMVQAAKARPW